MRANADPDSTGITFFQGFNRFRNQLKAEYEVLMRQMTEADKRAKEQAKLEWEMRRFHRQPKEKKKRRRSSEEGEDG